MTEDGGGASWGGGRAGAQRAVESMRYSEAATEVSYYLSPSSGFPPFQLSFPLPAHLHPSPQGVQGALLSQPGLLTMEGVLRVLGLLGAKTLRLFLFLSRPPVLWEVCVMMGLMCD